MCVSYLNCHEAGLCCYLVIRIENLLCPLRLFYFHLWPIYWLFLVWRNIRFAHVASTERFSSRAQQFFENLRRKCQTLHPPIWAPSILTAIGSDNPAAENLFKYNLQSLQDIPEMFSTYLQGALKAKWLLRGKVKNYPHFCFSNLFTLK
jgi:hypothetical protein